MKCLICNRLMIQIGTVRYECPFCGRAAYLTSGIVVAQTAAGIICVPKQSHPKHE